MRVVEPPLSLTGGRTGRSSTPTTTNSLHNSPRPSPSKRQHDISPRTSPDLGQSPSHEPTDLSRRVTRSRTSALGEVAVRAPSSGLSAVHSNQDEDFVEPVTSSTPPPDDEVGMSEMVGLGFEMKGACVGSEKVVVRGEGGMMTAKEAAANQTQKLHQIDPEMGSTLARMCSQYHLSEYNNLKRSLASGIPAPAPSYPNLPPVPIRTPIQRAHSSPPVSPSDPTASTADFPQRIPTRLLVPSLSTSPAVVAPIAQRPLLARAATVWGALFKATTPDPMPATAPSYSTSGSTPENGVTRVSTSSGLTALAVPRKVSPGPRASSVGFAGMSSTLTPSMGSFSFEEKSQIELETNKDELDEVKAEGTIANEELEEQLVQAANDTQAGTDQPRVVAPLSQLPPPPPIETLLPGMKVMNGVAVRTSASHPMNISPLVPPELLTVLGATILGPSSSTPRSGRRTPLSPSSAANSPALGSTTSQPWIVKPSPLGDLHSLVFSGQYGGFQCLQPITPLSATTKPLGNFVLSSCPGKKVRLDGAPARGGRSAICRDVKMDLARAKGEGVRVVICCLEDSELAYLGAPWDEYAEAARSLGLGVVRIPMVEGFAPQSPEMLDGLLEGVIRKHTLRGESVLAHCRGGIGRAGLVACAWMLKMGLVWEGRGEVDGVESMGEPLAVVGRVIELIRRRRSVKAIETAQQVHFLLEYVTFLRDQARVVDADEVVG